MPRRIGVASLDGCNHELKEFAIRLLELPSDLVQLPQAEERDCKHKHSDGPKLRIGPNNKQNCWKRQKVVRQRAERILFPDRPRTAVGYNPKRAAHAYRIRDEKHEEE